MQDLAPVIPQLPAPLLSRTADSISAMYHALTIIGARASIPKSRAPTLEQRRYMMQRRDTIELARTPLPVKEIRREIAALFLALAPPGGDAADTATTITLYARDLADVPGPALVAVLEKFRKGQLGSARWAPTVAQIRRAAEDHMAPFEQEAARIHLILNATVLPDPVRDPAKVAAAVAMARKVADELRNARPKNEWHKPEAPAAPVRTLEDLRVEFSHKPVRLSPALVETMLKASGKPFECVVCGQPPVRMKPTVCAACEATLDNEVDI